MNLADARTLAIQMVSTNAKHQDYQRTVDVDKDAYIYMTGDGIGEKITRIAQRESKEAKQQRVDLTIPITGAVLNSLEQPLDLVARNDRVRWAVTLNNEAKQKAVEEMMAGFYGSPDKKNKGLFYWLRSRFKHKQFIGPNSWTVIEWDAASINELIKPRPFDVKASEAYNFKIVNDEVQWLWVRQPSQYMKYTPPANSAMAIVNGISVPSPVAFPKYLENVTTANNGNKYTLYDSDYTIVLEQYDLYYMAAAGLSFADDEETQEIKGKNYVIRVYTPNLGFCPAFRNGYVEDDQTEGRTFVAPWYKAECYIRKTLKTVSEFDFTTSFLAVPQRYAYAPACSGPAATNKPCNKGRLPDNSICPNCKGNGLQPLPTSGQEVILFPFPKDPADMIDLDKMSATKAPPIDLVKWQNEYILQLEKQCHQAMYNSDVLVKTTQSTTNTGPSIETATENKNNWKSMENTLRPFTDKTSEVFVFIVKTIIALANANTEAATVYHVFPGDFKLKDFNDLMADLQAAVASGLPANLLVPIISDMADIVLKGDDEALQKFWVQAQYIPFFGLSDDAKVEKLTSPYVLDETKVMYEESERIFREIEQERADFYYMTDKKAQAKIVADKLKDVQDRLKEQTPDPVLPAFNAGSTANTGNVGDNANNDQQNSDQNVSVVDENAIS